MLCEVTFPALSCCLKGTVHTQTHISAACFSLDGGLECKKVAGLIPLPVVVPHPNTCTGGS